MQSDRDARSWFYRATQRFPAFRHQSISQDVPRTPLQLKELHQATPTGVALQENQLPQIDLSEPKPTYLKPEKLTNKRNRKLHWLIGLGLLGIGVGSVLSLAILRDNKEEVVEVEEDVQEEEIGEYEQEFVLRVAFEVACGLAEEDELLVACVDGKDILVCEENEVDDQSCGRGDNCEVNNLIVVVEDEDEICF